MIEATFFDLGRVLIHFDWTRTLESISKKSPHSPEQLRQLLVLDGLLLEYEVGRITTPDFFDKLRVKLQFEGLAAELHHLWCDIFSPLEVNCQCVERLVSQMPVGIISNTNDAHISFVEPRYPIFSHIVKERRFYSHILGCLKPYREIYTIAVNSVPGLPPESILFIDDLEANVEGARAMGWNAIHLPPGTDLAKELAAFGL